MPEPPIINDIRNFLNEKFNKHGFRYRWPRELYVSKEVYEEVKQFIFDQYPDWYREDDWFPSIKGIRIRVGQVNANIT
jgi:hypothetical protein